MELKWRHVRNLVDTRSQFLRHYEKISIGGKDGITDEGRHHPSAIRFSLPTVKSLGAKCGWPFVITH
jgi:hypothetical protein